MFGSFNTVVIMGSMTRDIEARSTTSGKRVGNFTLAVNEAKDVTHFFDCTAWEKTVEFLERFGGKGKTVLVQGRLSQEKWVDKQSGQTRSKVIVVANSVTFQSGDGAGEGQRERPDRTPGRNRSQQGSRREAAPQSSGYAQGADDWEYGEGGYSGADDNVAADSYDYD